MRITAGTIILLILLAPFIGYMIYVIAYTASIMRPPEISVPGPLSAPVSWTYSLLEYIYRALTNPYIVAFLLGIGLLYKAAESARH